MLRFFRQIRQQHLKENSFSNYALYAIGEILLVVIGILIALQINNWNEYRKERIMEKSYLIGIKTDLERDTAFLHQLYPNLETRMRRLNYLDSSFHLPSGINATLEDTVFRFSDLAFMARHFRPSTGTYSALVSDGKSNLILNRNLFNDIQNLYEIDNNSAAGLGSILAERSEKVKWENRLIFKDNPYLNHKEKISPALLSELTYLNDGYRFYYSFIKDMEKEIFRVIDLIELEIK